MSGKNEGRKKERKEKKIPKREEKGEKKKIREREVKDKESQLLVSIRFPAENRWLIQIEKLEDGLIKWQIQ